MAEHTRLQHIALTAKQPIKTVRFYQKVFGFEIGHIWGRDGKCYLLHMGDDSYLEINEERDKGADVGEGVWSHICLKTSDVERTYHLALENSVTSVHPAYAITTEGSHPRAPECSLAAIRGPEGENIGLIQEAGYAEDISETRVHHIGIHTRDTLGLARFYDYALGLAAAREWRGEHPSYMVGLGGNCYIEINYGEAKRPVCLSTYPHIALKSGDPAADYAKATAAGASRIHECMLCDVIEALPKPVIWRSAAVKGIEGEDISLMDDIKAGVWVSQPIL
jgi:catechol 2,3-dioxygenase-like lactoylglutathione lyase family enzyme